MFGNKRKLVGTDKGVEHHGTMWASMAMAAAGVRDAFFQRLGSSNVDALSVLEEVELIKSGILAGWAGGDLVHKSG